LGKLYAALAPVTGLLVRLVAGLSLAAHGYPKLFVNPEGNAEWFESIGFEPGLRVDAVDFRKRRISNNRA